MKGYKMYERTKHPFDLYFASEDDRKNIDWFYDNDYPLLYSQVNNRTWLNSSRFKSQTKGKLLLDSGAHSAHTKGIQLDVDEYINYANEHIDTVTLYVQVDHIPGKYRMPKTAKDWLESPALSWENYCYMRERSADPNKLVPVFHQGEDFKWLKNMCDARFDGEPIQYIGLSPRGDVSLQAKYDFCAECFGVIEESTNPNVKTHAFGATSLDMLERLPFTSADSTTCNMVCAFGQVWVPATLFGNNDTVGVKLGISNQNKSHETSTQVYWRQPKKVQDRLKEYFDSIGTSVELLADSYTERNRVSAIFCHNWAMNYEYKGRRSFIGKRPLF